MNDAKNEFMLDQEQQHAVEAMLSGRNVFLSGRAGTGKSKVIEEFKRRCSKNLVCLAPTGQASRHIGGVTIHSFFHLNLDLLPAQKSIIDVNYNLILANTEVFIIDEISMVSSAMFNLLDHILRNAPGTTRNTPFGGKQMIVAGDFCQLPPVIPDLTIRQCMENELGGVYAFETETWQQANFQHVILHNVYRQTAELFIKILDAVRTGELLQETDMVVAERWLKRDNLTIDTYINYLDYINTACFSPRRRPPQHDPIAICLTRAQVAEINQTKLATTPGQEFTFPATICGIYSENDYPTAQRLVLKRGMRVMILANQYGQDGKYECVNGDTGETIDFIPGATPMIKVRLDTGKTVDIKQFTWTNSRYTIIKGEDGKSKQQSETIGWFTQYPLMIAAAMTVHRLQGTTLNCPTRIVLGSKPCFCPWQFYVAASRCRELDQLSLDRKVTESDIMIDERIIAFYDRIDFNFDLRAGFYFKYFDITD